MAYSTIACVALVAAGLGLTWLFACLRFYSRHFILRSVGWDDRLAFLAVVLCTVVSGFYLDAITRYDFGHTGPSTSPAMRAKGLKSFFLCELLIITASGCIKLSFALTLYRVVRQRLHSYALHFSVICTVAISTVSFFLVMFACRPISAFWTSALDPGSGTCVDLGMINRIAYAQGTIILFLDILLGIIIPAHLLYDLRMDFRVKLSAGLLLGLGSLAGIATIVRLTYTPQIGSSLDTVNVVFLWASIEVFISTICTSAATLKPLFVQWSIFQGSTVHTHSYSLELETGDIRRTGVAKPSRTHTRTSTHGAGMVEKYDGRTSSTEAITWEGKELEGIQRTCQIETVSHPRSSTEHSRREMWDGSTQQGRNSWLDVQ